MTGRAGVKLNGVSTPPDSPATLRGLLSALGKDGHRLFATRVVRLFAYGFLSVVLVLYLVEAGLSEARIGLLLTLTLLGDTAMSLWLTTTADRFGRKRTLIAGAGLMLLAGVVFALTGNFLLLLVAATVGVISPSGNEVGPFLAVEQAALTQVVPGRDRTRTFAWYKLVGSFATAAGSLAGGAASQALQGAGASPLASYRAVVIGYAAFGVVLAALFAGLSPRRRGAGRRKVPGWQSDSACTARAAWWLRLAGLFSLDAFAGGFVVQSLVAYWFHRRFGVEPGGARRHLLRRQPPGRDLGARRRAGGRAGSASSTRWSSPTCRRTSCCCWCR